MPEDNSQEEREMTFGEKAVWLTFNHATWELWKSVHSVKKSFAAVIDLINTIGAWQEATYMSNTLRWMATRACISAQMAVVKYITWKD